MSCGTFKLWNLDFWSMAEKHFDKNNLEKWNYWDEKCEGYWPEIKSKFFILHKIFVNCIMTSHLIWIRCLRDGIFHHKLWFIIYDTVLVFKGISLKISPRVRRAFRNRRLIKSDFSWIRFHWGCTDFPNLSVSFFRSKI